MSFDLLFAPYLPWLPIWVFLGASLILSIALAWMRAGAWLLRSAVAFCILLALANPVVQSGTQTALSDIVLIVVDETASQSMAGRGDQTAQALGALQSEITRRDLGQIEIVTVPDGPAHEGSLIMQAISDALQDHPRDRIAGIFLITDGQIHDMAAAPNAVPAPLHVLLTGQPTDWDRQLTVKNAPAFAILGQPVQMVVRVEDVGTAPVSQTARVDLSLGGIGIGSTVVPINTDVTIEVDLSHGGENLLQLSTQVQTGELTPRNNTALININAVRDRLRVLLVSGEPHPGGRTWRNLLKSDTAVDLVHFTILRSMEKGDGVPVEEMSLIAFPARELFMDKIDEFDLIIFDRYQRRGILPDAYLANIVRYAQEGGAVLFAVGPAFAGVDSLYRSPLSMVMPATPTARVIQRPFAPAVTELGGKHPVTQGLSEFGPKDGWGRWLRQVEVVPTSGHVVMTGADDAPLLVLDEVGAGRVALLASDHAWLWDRGFEGGGPQAELLRRLSHWMMKEPDLEAEALFGRATRDGMSITLRSLSQSAPDAVQVTLPDGNVQNLPLQSQGAGLFRAELKTDQLGLFRLNAGEQTGVAARGASGHLEYQNPLAVDDIISDAAAQTGGGIFALSDGLPKLRVVQSGRVAAGRGWMALTPRDRVDVSNQTLRPLLPVWAYLIICTGLILGAWLREGSR